MLRTPTEIQIALHYYLVSDSDFPAISPEVRDDAMRAFVGHGLVSRATSPDRTRDYEPTEGLRVWIEALCEVPWPRIRWELPDD